MLQKMHKGAVHPGMRHSVCGIGGVGDDIGQGILQNGHYILLRGHEVHHGDLAVLPYQQVAAAIQRVLPPHGGNFRDALALIGMILRTVQTGEPNTVPSGQLGDVVKTLPLLDPPRQLPAHLLVLQAAHHSLHAAGEEIRRQDVDQLGRSRGVGIHIAPHIQSLLPCLLQKLQRPGDFHPPVVPAHGL